MLRTASAALPESHQSTRPSPARTSPTSSPQTRSPPRSRTSGRVSARQKRAAEQDSGAEPQRPPGAPEPVDEEAAKEERRKEREQAEAERREAVAHNMELGAQVAKLLAKIKVDERVVRILSAFNLSAELDKVAMRGARYGFPGWVTEETRKNGTVKHVYLERGDAQAKARAFLANASD